jgi:hypothetical protein
MTACGYRCGNNGRDVATPFQRKPDFFDATMFVAGNVVSGIFTTAGFGPGN